MLKRVNMVTGKQRKLPTNAIEDVWTVYLDASDLFIKKWSTEVGLVQLVDQLQFDLVA